jgi:hypothetical protein
MGRPDVYLIFFHWAYFAIAASILRLLLLSYPFSYTFYLLFLILLDSVTSVRFNPIETSIIATSSEDRCLRFLLSYPLFYLLFLILLDSVTSVRFNPIETSIIFLSSFSYFLSALSYSFRFCNFSSI